MVGAERLEEVGELEPKTPRDPEPEETHEGAELGARAAGSAGAVVEDDAVAGTGLQVGRRVDEDELLVQHAVDDLQTRVRLLIRHRVLPIIAQNTVNQFS